MKRPFAHLLIALGILTAALIAYGIAYHVLGKMSASTASLAAEVAAKKESASAAALAEEELKRLVQEEAAIAAYFVVPDDIVSFLETLQEEGKMLGTDVTVISVSAVPTPRPHLDLALKVEGTFDAVTRTVGAIEYSPFDLTVSSLVLDSVQEPTESGNASTGEWTAQMKLSVGTASSTPTTP